MNIIVTHRRETSAGALRQAASMLFGRWGVRMVAGCIAATVCFAGCSEPISNTGYARSTRDVSPTRAVGDVYVSLLLAAGFDEGVNTSGKKMNWVADGQGFMMCNYPAGEQWGAVFITVGKPTSAIAERKTVDFSSFNFMVLELKGSLGGEMVDIGIKADNDADLGLEPKHLVSNLTTDWQTFKIPLSEFTRQPDCSASRLRRLYVVCELVFEPGFPPEGVSFRNIRYE
jgi:hypothetical protein